MAIHPLRILLALLLAVPVLVLATGTPAHACSCVELTPQLLRTESDAVFSGTVEETRVDGAQGATRVAVDGVWAGDVAAHTEVVHGTEGSSCGLSPVEGERILLSASVEEGELRTSSCSVVTGQGDVDRMASALGDAQSPRPGTIEATSVGGPPIVWFAVGGLVLVLAAALVVRRRATGSG